jgi:phasin
VHKTTGAMDGAAGTPALAGVKDVSTKAVSFAEKNVTAAFDLAEKLVHAKDVSEMMALQTEFLKAQMEAVQAQARELGESVVKVAGVKA